MQEADPEDEEEDPQPPPQGREAEGPEGESRWAGRLGGAGLGTHVSSCRACSQWKEPAFAVAPSPHSLRTPNSCALLAGWGMSLKRESWGTMKGPSPPRCLGEGASASHAPGAGVRDQAGGVAVCERGLFRGAGGCLLSVALQPLLGGCRPSPWGALMALSPLTGPRSPPSYGQAIRVSVSI